MYKLLPLLLFLIPSFVDAQYNTKDAGLWSTFSIKKEINFRNYIALDQEFRLHENYSMLNLFYTNIGYGYKFSKELKTEITYRAVQKYVFDYFSYRHRLMVDLIYKKKFSTIAFTNRFRYQIEVRDLLSSVDGKYPEQYFRHKLDFAYDNDQKLIPSYSIEFRYQLDLPRKQGKEYNNSLHRIRNSFGLDYKINKKNTVGIYYLIQSEFGIKSPENNFITGIQYAINLE